jgi:hemolysin activation/secretion protein
MVATPNCNSASLHSAPLNGLPEMPEICRGRLKTRFGLGALLVTLACLCGVACAAPEAAVAPRLDLLEFRVEGNTVLSRMAIEQAVYPVLGPDKTIADVEKARVALEAAYHDAGFLTVTVSVPEQKVNDGVVRLNVTEGVIERTRVTGAHYTLPSRIRAETPSTAEGVVPDFTEMQRELAAVSRAPGVRVTPTLEPGRRPGTTALELKVSDTSPVAASLDLNNAHSANTSSTRSSGSVSYNNLFQRAHTLSLQSQTAPENPGEASALSASYTVPLDGYSRYLSLYAVHSTSNVNSAAVNVGDQVLFGNNDIVGARYIVPLRARPGLQHQLTLGLDFKDSRQQVNGLSTPLRYWTADANYGWGLSDDSGNWQLGVGTVLGLRGPGTGDVSFGQRRYLAHNSFAVLKLNAQRQQKLPAGWALTGSADVQLADQALINNEQMSAGGAGSVRGYLQSEAAGDQGVHASLELRAPTWMPGAWPLLKSVQAYAFYDAAYLRVNDALPAELAAHTLDAVGLGLDLRAGRALSLSLSVAEALTDGPKNDLTTSPPQPFTRAHDVRVQFDTRLDF